MNQQRTSTNPWERLIEAMDRPLLALAVLTMAVYLLDLLGVLSWGRTALVVMTLLVDLVFVFDLLLKLRVYGTSYIQTPWFLIDLISCLPLLDGLANGVRHLRAIRFVRGLRILRILRGLRILRALRSIPAYERLVKESPASEGEKKIHHYMNLGMVGLTVAVLVFIVVIRRQMEGGYIKKIDAELRGDLDRPLLRAIGGSLVRPENGNYLERKANVDGRVRDVYFDLQRIDELSDMTEFFVIVGMMLAMLFLMYIIAYHQLDVSQAQLRALLNLALPRQVADQLVLEPTAYTRKSRMPATVVFMDFVGFTRTCEALAHDPDRLSQHLEAAMDRLVNELVRHDLIIDKFIGDAIMSFRGGPLVSGDPPDHAYRTVRAALASIKALATLNDPYFDRVKIGGASADDCLIGAFGTSARLSYTILGDGVNLAARLEPACAQCGTKNLFCETTHHLCAGRPDLIWRRWGRIRVAGKSAPLNVYEAFDRADLGDASFLATFHRALDAFDRSDFDHARDLFVQASSQRLDGDEPSRSYARWCEKLLLGGPPVGWEPVFETHK